VGSRIISPQGYLHLLRDTGSLEAVAKETHRKVLKSQIQNQLAWETSAISAGSAVSIIGLAVGFPAVGALLGAGVQSLIGLGARQSQRELTKRKHHADKRLLEGLRILAGVAPSVLERGEVVLTGPRGTLAPRPAGIVAQVALQKFYRGIAAGMVEADATKRGLLAGRVA